jgi:hypothetical protein
MFLVLFDILTKSARNEKKNWRYQGMIYIRRAFFCGTSQHFSPPSWMLCSMNSISSLVPSPVDEGRGFNHQVCPGTIGSCASHPFRSFYLFDGKPLSSPFHNEIMGVFFS